MNLIRTILTAPWMIEKGATMAALPVVTRLLKGEKVDFNQSEDYRPFAFSANAMRRTRFYNFGNAPAGSIAVYPIDGFITKQDQFCGPMGTESLMKQMGEVDEMNNISGHLLKIDSGGGEGTNIEIFSRFLRTTLKKPVVAWFNGYNASAAYYISAGADEIYAGLQTDMVGSIGVMLSFADMREHFEKEGIKLHEVYAKHSDLKNEDIKEAREGNYDKIREKLLDPFAEVMIKTIKEFRPGLKEKDAFRGEIYSAEAAVEIGMIDGIITFEAAVDRVIQLANDRISSTNNIEMKRIELILGYDLEIQDGGVFLQEQELQKLDRHLVAEGFEAVESSQLEAIQTSITDLSAQMAEGNRKLEAKITALEKTVDQHTQQIRALGDAPGAAETKVFSDKDKPEADPVPDALDALDKAAMDAARNGMAHFG